MSNELYRSIVVAKLIIVEYEKYTKETRYTQIKK